MSEPQRTTLATMRTTLRALLPDAEEAMKYSSPTFVVEEAMKYSSPTFVVEGKNIAG